MTSAHNCLVKTLTLRAGQNAKCYLTHALHTTVSALAVSDTALVSEMLLGLQKVAVSLKRDLLLVAIDFP